MIAITTDKKIPLRFLPRNHEEAFGYHRLFGFVSEETARTRHAMRRERGHHEPYDMWLFRFSVKDRAEDFIVEGSANCSAARDQDKWVLTTPVGEYYVVDPSKHALAVEAMCEIVDRKLRREWLPPILVVLMTILVTAVGLFTVTSTEVASDMQKIAEATKEQKEVVIPKVKVVEAPKPPEVVQETPKVQPKPKSGAGTPNNLGFLALVGRKDLSKAAGGMPTNMKNVTAGAGQGGDAGSGGEMLTGLGQGLKQTTVGNTGVAGMGGIGKAGAGGGAGGQGRAFIGSGGGGQGLSNVAVSSDMVLDGGLDRNVIQATIAKYISQVRSCYEQGLRQKPELAGQVTMNFEINSTGALNFAKVSKTSLGHPGVEGCISTKMLTWQFPKPLGGVNVKVSYPFVLSPAGRSS